MTNRQCVILASKVWDWFNEMDPYDYSSDIREQTIADTARALEKDPVGEAEKILSAVADFCSDFCDDDKIATVINRSVKAFLAEARKEANDEKKSNTVFYAELDRFGNTYRAIGRTREEAVDALLADYCEQFERWNGADPEQTGCEDEWLDTDTGKWYDRYDEELEEKPYT